MLPRPSAQETVAALYGAWRLFLRDPAGLRYLPEGIEATARSFYAAILCLPAYWLLQWLQPVPEGVVPLTLLQSLPAELIGYVLQWVAYPVLLVHVLGWMEKPQHWAMLVTGLNWSGVLQLHLSGLASLLAWSGLLPDGVGVALALAVLGVTLSYRGYIIRLVLGVSSWVAVGLVMLDLILGLFIMQGVLMITRVP